MMKQAEITDKIYDDLIKITEDHQSAYDTELKRRNKLASEDNLKKYDKLLKEFHEFAKAYEDEIRYMYIDSNFYTTVGCGHLLGFSTFSFWTSEEAKDVLANLKTQIDTDKLSTADTFKKIDSPDSLDSVLNVTSDDYLKIFKTKYVSFGFLDTKNFDFKKKTATELEEQINEPNTYQKTVLKAYVRLLGWGLKLRARQKSLNRTTINPFKGTSFYKLEENSLVIDNEQIKNHAYKDILVKLGEMKPSFKNFDNFPFAAQKALLDLAYNKGSIPKKVISSAQDEDWEKLTDEKLYERTDASFATRNAQVKKWFEEAKNEKALKEAETTKGKQAEAKAMPQPAKK